MTGDSIGDTVQFSIGLDTIVGTDMEYDVDGDISHSTPVTLGQMVARLVADNITQQISREARSEYLKPVRDRLDALADQLVEEKLREVMAREIVPTDPYGNAKGEPQTLAELIAKRAEAWLKAPETRDGYGSQRTNFQKLIDTEVGRAWQTEVTKAITEAKAQVQARISKQAADVFAEVIQRAATR